ncbi:hypothetical protein [Methylotenera sp.]|uniref:type IV pilus assembly protein FimV n=1 Tax=Methylotenera sp. TaxID=2051956 RepID=UPI0024884AD2|nr:hypothetical protein [Methylotenera sp.]MDI1298282.1 hypothetical protein [Methylotenera sp.]
MRFFTLLSLFCFANLSFALGLGDAELKSNLGEKFLARVNVTDIESAPDSICFSATDLGEVPAFKRASVNLREINGNYQLMISSNDVITEPIVNLRVSFHCEPNVNREYVLLLDPAPISAAEKVNISDDSANIEPSASDTKKSSRKSPQSSNKKLHASEVAEQADEATPEQATVKKSPKNKKPKKFSSVDEKLNEAYIGKQNTSPTPQSSSSAESKVNADVREHKPSADKPFLVISAGNTNAAEVNEKPGLSLRLATEIDVARPDEVAATQTATDTMDEVTVMSNRLAHLEKQIASLQSRNAQLVTEAQKSKEESERFDWLKFLKIALGILVAIALLELLRRKFTNRETYVKDTWFDDEDPDDTDHKVGANSANEFNAQHANTPSFDEPNFNQTPMHHLNATDAQAMGIAEKEEHSSIIEDADVFIEHGRPALAIQLLQNYLTNSPADSPAVWLKLLNLLSKEDSETEYDSAVIECNKHFNIKAANFGDDLAADDSSIEDYPHIVTRLEGVWGSPYAVGFLNDLIFNKRSQPREGLNQGAFNDLFFLKNIAKNLEYANPTIFKASSDQPDSNQLKLNQPSVAAINIANTSFNDALFTDIEPLTDVSADSKNALNDTQLGTKSNFSSFNDETSYEVNMIPHDEPSPTLSTKDDALEFEMPERTAISKDDESLFSAEEINFSLPTEKVEYATEHKANMFNEEIVLDDSEKVVTDKNSLLDFSLEFPSEDKPKIKSKAKASAAENQSEANEIEWDLPTIEPELKPKK